MMTIDDLKQLLDMVREHDLAEFELELEGMKLRVRKQSPETAMAAVAGPRAAAASASPSAATSAGSGGDAPSAGSGVTDLDEAMALAVVKSPIVGTFYRSASPGSPSFVEVGSIVKKGQVICIIEAMKLMNEIESEYDGEVVKIYVENGQPVQYGERLYAVRAT